MKTIKNTTRAVALLAALIVLMTSCASIAHTKKLSTEAKTELERLDTLYKVKKLQSFVVKVPQGFSVDSVLKRKADACMKSPGGLEKDEAANFSYFIGKFNSASDPLQPGKRYLVQVYRTDANNTGMPSDSVIKYMSLLKADFVGTPGLIFLYDKYKWKMRQITGNASWRSTSFSSYDREEALPAISIDNYYDRSIHTGTSNGLVTFGYYGYTSNGTYFQPEVGPEITDTVHMFLVLLGGWQWGTDSYESGMPVQSTTLHNDGAFLVFYELKPNIVFLLDKTKK